jgi:hypothetical protein
MKYDLEGKLKGNFTLAKGVIYMEALRKFTILNRTQQTSGPWFYSAYPVYEAGLL